ncbi:hypothetical protein IFM89_017241 [Coptis chinensis]|uniref:Uncharacterized protein n=1 Tax=Coptis chinensis TaxID=261450 RepID=A0A835LIZ4_9MAGN|nr:hypothetical protein IFM89_017241 [Coptis chinensis]
MVESDLLYFTMCTIILVISTLAIRAIFWRSQNRLPPSPLALPILGHLHLLGPIPHQAFHTLSTKYGPLIYLLLGSVPCVLASTAETAKEFLKTHELSFSSRPSSSAIDYLTYGSADFSFAPYGPYWKFMKKIVMTELLGGRTLDQLLNVRREEIQRFLVLMLRKSDADPDAPSSTVFAVPTEPLRYAKRHPFPKLLWEKLPWQLFAILSPFRHIVPEDQPLTL